MLAVFALLLVLVSQVASAAPRAWLDRNRIALGETVTLSIATTGTQVPDYTPLQAGFAPHNHTSQRRFELVNGQATMHSLYTVALRPQRAGRVTIPSVPVGSDATAPLTLEVSAAAPQTPARAGDDVFIESVPDDLDPYVQQAVGWVVRLYSAVPLVSGHLDQPAPEGAALQRIGDDAQYTREIDGRRYTVVERRYLLVPERSGELVVPGAVFEGRGVGGFFDSLFGDRGGALQARGPTRVLQVRAVPAGAPQPWLPLHALKLRYAMTPDRLQAGRAATVAVELVADGATAAQLPALELPPIDGVQVFAEPPQSDERFVDGRPRVTLTRRFALVPSQAGAVRLPGLRVPWWDVGGAQRRVAELPPLEWQAQPGAANAAGANRPDAMGAGGDAAAAGSRMDGDVAGNTASGATRRWIVLAMVFAALWLATLVWALQRRVVRDVRADAAASRRAVTGTRAAPVPSKADLRRVLDTGGADEIVATLQAMAQPPADTVDELAARLDDPAQRTALDILQRARWGGGDLPEARRAMRGAFADGPRWRAAAPVAREVLPPLYPERRNGP